MPCPVIQKNTTILPSPGADLTVLIPTGLLALPHASLQGGGPVGQQAPTPTPGLLSSPHNLSVHCSRLSETQLFIFPSFLWIRGQGRRLMVRGPNLPFLPPPASPSAMRPYVDLLCQTFALSWI